MSSTCVIEFALQRHMRDQNIAGERYQEIKVMQLVKFLKYKHPNNAFGENSKGKDLHNVK
jgi:hypothetical protein